jgi:X-Pro dipeptidyl-peptidase
MRDAMRGAVGFLAALALVAAPAAAGGPPYGEKRESYVVTTRHGLIYVEVVRPVDGEQTVKGPAIFTYSPYSVLGRNGDASRWVPRGYARVWADVVGTGNSGGCWDYGGIREKETGYELVEWIAAQPWSTGKVGMIGSSYNGTTATATAVTAPPHLTTIVPEAAISRWYEYAFSGGIRYFINNENPADEGVDTPLAFDFGLAIPPPLDVTDPSWGERVKSTVLPCDELQHTGHGYDNDTPDYDAFWLERDYIKDADKIAIPVLVAHNWGDWNVKQEEAINLYRALTNAPVKKLYMGTRYSGHGRPGGNYPQTVDRWFDHFLMGIANGVENIPSVHSQMSNYDGPTTWYAGPWPDTTPVTLYAQEDGADPNYAWKLLPTLKEQPGAGPTFVSTGTNTEAGANTDPRKNTRWFWFETPPLASDLRIFGEVKVRLWSTIARQWITYTPTIVDVDPARRVIGPGQLLATDSRGLLPATRGWLDSRSRLSLASPSLVAPGESFEMTIVEKPQDYTFERGHLIGLAVQTEIHEWSLVKPDPNCTTAACSQVRIDLDKGQTNVVLPVVAEQATAVSVFAATARCDARGVIVRWQTAAEVGIAGFHIYRGPSAKRSWLARTLIPAGGGAVGRGYAFRDRTAPASGQLRYWLREVRRDGSRRWYGPIVLARGQLRR